VKPALPATYDNVRRQQLRDGIALSTQAKVAFFEEMVALAMRFGARDRLRVETPPRNGGEA
jgi:hypothetical protein